jgi:hypothetical protein
MRMLPALGLAVLLSCAHAPDRRDIAARDVTADRWVEDTFRAAVGLRRLDRLDDALPLFAAIAVARPDHPLAEYAVNLLLADLHRLERYRQLAAWLDLLLVDPRLLKGRKHQRAHLRCARFGCGRP